MSVPSFRSNQSILSLFILGLFLGLTLSGVPAPRAEAKPALVIFPFIVEKVEDPARGAVCPVCKGFRRSSEVLPGAAPRILTRELYEKMEASGIFAVLPLEKVEEGLFHWGRKRFEEAPVSSLIQLGKEFKADFVFVGIIFRFEERVGSSLGVEKPASVAFDLHLFRMRDGKKVWDGGFDETQRPLSENLFQIGSFFRRKAKWLTAEELAVVGMEEVLKKFPEIQELETKP
ncbi:MAG TPA: hypothetical protein VLK23_04935 [Thermodesulfobacteriota bacterium]|nr:hypothetical protein [Thermodesulfobacteriota bacterium]